MLLNFQIVDSSAVQTAFNVPVLISTHSPDGATTMNDSVDSLRQRALQYVASLGYLRH